MCVQFCAEGLSIISLFVARMVKTGDVILFSKRVSWFERAISYFTGSPYTHVGLVIVDPPGLPPGPHLIESGVEPMLDEKTGRRIIGVQVHPLASALATNGDAFLCELQLASPDADLTTRLWNCENRVHGSPYDINPIDWLRAELRVLCPSLEFEQQASSFWCSALVAYLYVKLGFLPACVPWTLVSPAEWGPRGSLRPILQGCALGAPRPMDPSA